MTTETFPVAGPPNGDRQSSRWRTLLAGLLLVVATLIAYQPAWHAGYIWDDDDYVTKNPVLHSPDGLRQIWFQAGVTPQYYPLVFTTFWLEHLLWEFNATGYHITNILLHAVGAILLWRILNFLRIPGAWLAAALFAVHPVAVESVAWITERKNVLSAVFYFAAALAYLRWNDYRTAGQQTTDDETTDNGPRVGNEERGEGESGNRGRERERGRGGIKEGGFYKWYWFALGAFVLALLSKTVTCSLPAALLLIIWWKNGRLKLKDVLPLLPFFALGISLGLVTAHLEKHLVGATGTDWALSFWERCLIAGRAAWFYAGKLVWPANLTFIYPRWTIDTGVWWQWLFPVSAVMGIVALWLMRHRWGRGPLVAVLFFGGTLFPALGFVNVFPMRFSFVADHFQYLASVGILTLLATGIVRLFDMLKAGRSALIYMSCTVVLVALGMQTWRQCRIYENSETLWAANIQANPTSWLAAYNLGTILTGRGSYDEGVKHLQHAVKIKPDFAIARYNLGCVLLHEGRIDEAIEQLKKASELEPEQPLPHYKLGGAFVQNAMIDEGILEYRKSLELNPNFADGHRYLGVTLLYSKGEVDEAIRHFQRAIELNPAYAEANNYLGIALLQKGRARDAALNFEMAITLQPKYVLAANNLAWLLATTDDTQLRNGAKALALAQDADRNSGGQNPMVIMTLGAAYAETGQFADAIMAAERAMKLGAQNNPGLVETLKVQMESYKQGKALRSAIGQ